MVHRWWLVVGGWWWVVGGGGRWCTKISMYHIALAFGAIEPRVGNSKTQAQFKDIVISDTSNETRSALAAIRAGSQLFGITGHPC